MKLLRSTRFCSLFFPGLLLITAAVPSLRAGVEFQSPPKEEAAGWKIEWKTIPGQQYRLQRSSDLSAWQDVFASPLTATGSVLSFTDSAARGQARVYWRVMRLGGPSEPVTVSDPTAVFRSTSSGLRAELGIITGGTETVQSVVFFNGTQELGPGVPGTGNAWTLALPDDFFDPLAVSLKARVTTEEGTVLDTPVQRLLLAPPARFIPLGSNGQRLYGQLIELDAQDKLGPFVFYPEGLSDEVTTTGVHFEFTAGAEIQPIGAEPGIRFNAAKFYGGHADKQPDSISGGPHHFEIDRVQPSVLTGMTGRAAGSPIPLVWGRTTLLWTGGILTTDGWSSLQLSLPSADFILPQQRLNARVTINPDTGSPQIVISYHGRWAPLPGATEFTVPQAEPLKLYITQDSILSASGTVEAEFPGGAKARGSIVWRDPVFEVRFQGRDFIIPALGAVRRLLPANPEECVPETATSAEQLDAAAACLESYRDVYRHVAAGGREQSAMNSTAATAPPSSPQDTAGAALSAWAARLASWTADRAGQTLAAADLAELRKAVEDAVKTGTAAHDPATPVQMLRDVISLRLHAPGSVGTTAEAQTFLTSLTNAEDALFTAVERLAANRPEFASPAEFGDLATLLLTAEEEAGSLPAAGGAGLRAQRDNANPSRDRLRRLAAVVAQKSGIARRVAVGASSSGPPMFSVMTAGDQLKFLAEMTDYFRALKAQGLATRASNAPAETGLMACLLNLRQSFGPKHEDDFLNGGITFTTDYSQLRQRLADRARFLLLNERLGEPLASNDALFSPPTPAFLDSYALAFSGRPLLENTAFCTADLENLSSILDSTTDQGRASDLEQARQLLMTCVDELRKVNAANDCDVLGQLLRGLNLPVMRGNPAFEGDQIVKVTGQYESTGNLETMQLNQGGRLLRGYLQFPAGGGRSQRMRIDGLLLRETSTTSEFSVILSDDTPTLTQSGIRRAGKLTARQAGVRTEIDLVTSAQGSVAVLAPGPRTTNFRLTTPAPAWSPRLTSALSGEAREVFQAQQNAPLHSTQIAQLRTTIGPVITAVNNYLSSSLSTPQRLALATQINASLAAALSVVSTEQIPVARQMLRQLLTRSNITAEGLSQSTWNWLRVIFSRHAGENPTFITSFSAFMGPEISATVGASAFRYTIKISTASLDVEVLGVNTVTFDIEKRAAGAPAGSPPASTISLQGIFGQGGIGPSLAFPVAVGGDDAEVLSGVDYTGPSLSGPMMLLGGSAGVGVGFDARSVNAGAIFLYGNGSLPPFAIPLPTVSGGDNELSIGAELNLGIGVVGTINPNTPAQQFSLVTEPIRTTSAQAGSEGSVHFDLNAAVLRPCGRIGLREFVAEYRAIFESPQSTVSILGFTDSSGGDAFNALLSQQRADSVKQALRDIMGPDLEVPAAKLRAIGLGENPSQGLALPPGITLNETEAAMVARKKALFAPELQNNVKDQRWRTVTVILNNLVTVDLNTSLQETAPAP